jgi:putative ABC transport system permease protein
VIQLWYSGVESAQPDRLAVRNKISLTQSLPIYYLQRIKGIPGVDAVTFGGWFGGRISERAADFFPNFFVDSSTYLRVFDEYIIPPAQITAWQDDPCGAIAGKALADRLGWKVGERITLAGEVYPGEWTFTIRGIFRGKRPEVDTTTLYFEHRCINEKIPETKKNLVSYFAVRIDDPSRSAFIANQIDGMFQNSAYPTKTESEKAFQLGFVAMSGAILQAIRIVSYVILIIILLVVGNTIAMGVRERIIEFSTLRAIGFRRKHVLFLILSSSVAIGAVAAGLGAILAPLLTSTFVDIVSRSAGYIPKAVTTPQTLALAAIASLLAGTVAGLLPAIRAATLPIAEGLRKAA